LEPKAPGEVESNKDARAGSRAAGKLFDEQFVQRRDELLLRPPSTAERATASNGMVLDMAESDVFNPGTRFEGKRADQRGYATTIGGVQSIQYFGPRKDDNFNLTRTAGGAYEVRAAEADQPFKLSTDAKVTEAREVLLKGAESRISDHLELAKFRADVARFEDRAGKDKISSVDIVKTYENVNRLFKTQPPTAVAPDWTPRLAQQVMAQAATLTNIDQGGYNTCNVTTVESMMYTYHPDMAARMVADLALKGEFTGADGTRVKMDAASLRPSKEALTHPPVDGERSFATQLANVALTNMHYAKHDRNLRYEQHPPDNPTDNGERLIDYGKRPPQRVKEDGAEVNAPHLDDDHMVDIFRRVTGDNRKDVYLSHEQYAAGEGKLLTKFTTEEQLATKLEQLQKDGGLPVILSVNCHVEPFWSASGGGTESDNEGAHVVTVRHYDKGPPVKVQIDNQYGTKGDHGLGNEISLRQLYMATLPTKQAVDMFQQKVEADRVTTGNKNYHDELDLLRMQRLDERLTPAEYNAALKSLIKETTDHFDEKRRTGTLDEQEYERTKVKIGDLIETQDSLGKIQSFRALLGKGVLSEETYAEGVKLVMEYAFTRKDKLTEQKKYDSAARTTFGAAMKEMSGLLDQMSPEQRNKAFGFMDDKLASRIIGNLPAAQQLRIKRQLLESGRRLP
jgi:hypothetical protein